MIGKVISLFDESGNMVRPWAEAGYRCWCFDIVNEGKPVEHFLSGGSINYVAADLDDPSWQWTIEDMQPSILFSFSPCTDTANSGAAHFASKLAKDPWCQNRAVARAKLVEKIADRHGVPYMHEHPRSILSTRWRPTDFEFDPSDYGGYLPKDDVHPRWPEYIAPRDAYPKRTCIRHGNGFKVPPMRKVEREPGYSTQHKKLGGKSAKTKQIRSETPRGWALAVCGSNNSSASFYEVLGL